MFSAIVCSETDGDGVGLDMEVGVGEAALTRCEYCCENPLTIIVEKNSAMIGVIMLFFCIVIVKITLYHNVAVVYTALRLDSTLVPSLVKTVTLIELAPLISVTS